MASPKGGFEYCYNNIAHFASLDQLKNDTIIFDFSVNADGDMEDQGFSGLNDYHTSLFIQNSCQWEPAMMGAKQ